MRQARRRQGKPPGSGAEINESRGGIQAQIDKQLEVGPGIGLGLCVVRSRILRLEMFVAGMRELVEPPRR